MDTVSLYKECKKVRCALECAASTGQSDLAILSKFPLGCCGLICRVLGPLLMEKDPNGVFYFVSGQRGLQSHAWLEHNGFIIDITADQFPEVSKKVIVTKSSSFHTNFVINNRRGSYVNQLDEFPERTIYRYLLDYLEQFETSQK